MWRAEGLGVLSIKQDPFPSILLILFDILPFIYTIIPQHLLQVTYTLSSIVLLVSALFWLVLSNNALLGPLIESTALHFCISFRLKNN